MKTPHNDNQVILESLLNKLLDGSITKAEHGDLEHLLLSNPEAQESYFKLLDLDTDLRAMSQSDGAAPQTAATTSSNSRSWRSVAVLVGGLALAASLLVATFVRQPVDDSVPVASTEVPHDAILVQSAGGQFFRDAIPLVGQSLKSRHTYALTDGLIELKFRNGAEVILEAPAVLEVASGDRLIVRQGLCSVHAPPGAEGFRVVTPQSEVVDLGTRFSVAVAEGGDTEVQVIEGAAEIIKPNLASGKPLLLKEREASRSSGGQLRSIEFSGQQYRRDLPDRVIAFQIDSANEEPSGLLKSVLVQRGGVPIEYLPDELAGVEVTYFRGGKSTQHFSVTVGEVAETERSRRDLLESDRWLHTGILNMGGSEHALTDNPLLTATDAEQTTPGMAIRFRRPIVNDVGPDVVFFELQSVVNPPDGDAFHVSPVRFEPGLKSMTIRRYDITLNSAEAIPIPSFDILHSKISASSLEELLTGTYTQHKSSIPFFAIAVGVDLSDLGYAKGAEVSELFFQDAADDVEHQVDPVFIGGLPVLSQDMK
jgi:ferric-dicitrate binding protein FerR (iron transport regulator)